MIIVFSTAKSGTVSCSEWLDLPHEKTDWRGSVAWFNILNLDYWLEQDVTRILLMRDREDFIDSYLNRGVIDQMQKMLPQFDFSTAKGLGQYWDWYNNKCLEHEDRFIVIGTEQIPFKLNQRRNYA